jgi:type II secretory pathway component PulF
VMGVRFHLLAAHLENGLRLGQALEKVPRLLPPQITAMLRAGGELGDLRKVLPACRYLLKDAQSSVYGAASYLVVLAFVLSPATILVFNTLAVLIFPKFSEIVREMGVTPPALFQLTLAIWRWLSLAQAAICTVLLVAALTYVGGPCVVRWFQFRALPFADWIAWHVPWKQKRLQRNFSAILAATLDGGVPEAVALRLAGDCAANEIFRRRVARAQVALADGAKLTDVVQLLDDRGEFRWRLTNAVHAHSGFLRALTGWHESLDARAFQQEQAAAHIVTSALVVANGVLVALVALAVFGALIAVIDTGVLW